MEVRRRRERNFSEYICTLIQPARRSRTSLHHTLPFYLSISLSLFVLCFRVQLPPPNYPHESEKSFRPLPGPSPRPLLKKACGFGAVAACVSPASGRCRRHHRQQPRAWRLPAGGESAIRPLAPGCDCSAPDSARRTAGSQTKPGLK